MKTLTACILLTLAAAAVHCMPLAEVTVADEALAEVWELALSLPVYPYWHDNLDSVFHMSAPNERIAGACFHDDRFFCWLQSYLRRFFNLTEEHGPSVRRRISSFSLKLSEMQRFFGLQITGTLDENTVELMKKPRCGVPDSNIAEYSTFGSNLKWQKNSLTYRWRIDTIWEGILVSCLESIVNVFFSQIPPPTFQDCELHARHAGVPGRWFYWKSPAGLGQSHPSEVHKDPHRHCWYHDLLWERMWVPAPFFPEVFSMQKFSQLAWKPWIHWLASL